MIESPWQYPCIHYPNLLFILHQGRELLRVYRLCLSFILPVILDTVFSSSPVKRVSVIPSFDHSWPRHLLFHESTQRLICVYREWCVPYTPFLLSTDPHEDRLLRSPQNVHTSNHNLSSAPFSSTPWIPHLLRSLRPLSPGHETDSVTRKRTTITPQ